MRNIKGLTQSFRIALVGQKVSSLSAEMDKALRGTKVRLEDGTVITVATVDNAGFNGMQVRGVTADGTRRMGFSR